MISFFYSLLLLAGWAESPYPAPPAAQHPDNLQPAIAVDSVRDARCAGSADGAVFVTVKNGVEPYAFLWSTGADAQNLMNVPAGIYGLTVTDAEGNTAEVIDIPVGEPEALTVSLDSLLAPDCLGEPGFIDVAASGGTPPYTFEWAHGDEGDFLTELPEGEYAVVATDANGCTAVYEVGLYTDFPDASANDTLIDCHTGPSVVLSGEESTGGAHVAYAWTTLDGLIESDPDSVSISVGGGGVYTLLVTNTLNGCTAEAEAIVTVDTLAPAADAGEDFTTPCTNSIDTLRGTGAAGAGFAYLWTAFDGGQLTGRTDTLVAVFDHTGGFVLHILDETNGCSHTDTVRVTGLHEPPAALAYGDTLTCVVDSVLLTADYDTLNTTIAWEGPEDFTSLLPEPKVGDAGIFTLSVTDTLTGCVSKTFAEVALDTLKPLIHFVLTDQITCLHPLAQIGVQVDTNFAGSFYWTGPDDFESVDQNPQVTAAGEYVVFVTKGSNGCVASDTTEVTSDLAPPVVDAGDDKTLNCQTETVTLDGSGSASGAAYSYTWTTLDGHITGAENTVTTTADQPGTYTLTVVNGQNGCTASDDVVVTEEFTAPVVSVSVSDTISCLASVVQLASIVEPAADVALSWSGPGGFSSTMPDPTVFLGGEYTLTVTYLPSGCTASASVTVISTAPYADAGLSMALTCTATSVQLNGTGSSAGEHFTYTWTTFDGNIVSGANTLTPVADAVGTYVLTVVDTVNGCSAMAEMAVTQNLTAPVADAGPNLNLTCADPKIQLDGTGSTGHPALGYAWSTLDGNIATGAGTAMPFVDAVGQYTLVVTNPVNGCTDSDTVLVGADQSVPDASAESAGGFTCLVNTGQLLGSSATPGAAYQWTGPNGFLSNLQNPQVPLTGTYVLTVTDPANGCTAVSVVTILQNTMPPTLTASVGPITCAHPSVMIMTTVQPLDATFVWSGPNNFSSTLQNPVVDQTGIYIVVATNPANGCTNSVSAQVTRNITPPTVNATVAGVLTCTQTSVTLNASATPAGTTFAWSGPDGFTATTASASGATPGMYTVTATSPVNGCTALTTVEVTSNTSTPVAFAGPDRPLNCASGILILSGGFDAAGGTQFTYTWTTADGNIVLGENTLMPRVDQPGTYVLVVTNTQTGCSDSDETEVTEPVTLTAQAIQTQVITCHGGTNGAATVTPTGGSGAYTYQWTGGAHTATANNLSAGIYSVTVTDTEGCSVITTATVTEPSLLTVNVTATPETLPGAGNGAATASGSGGTPPYTYHWNTNVNTAAITGLAPGAYFVTATDLNGCTATGIANVNASSCALAATVTATPVSCAGQNNGSAVASATGAVGTPVYAWSTGASGPSLQNLAPGNYTLSVSDGAGCQVTVPVQITAPQPLSLSIVSQQNVLCLNDQTGAIGVATAGGTPPYTLEWSNEATGTSLSGLAPGVYTATATDANGCSQTLEATIVTTDHNPPLLVLQNAEIALDVNGQAALSVAIFDDGSADAECAIASWAISPESFDCAQVGVHTVYLTATDVNGNAATDSVLVTITDKIIPVLTCPSSVSVGACDATVTFAAPQIVDNCPADPAQLVLSNGLPSGSDFPEGLTQQQFSYTDPGGNAATCSFTVTVSPALSVVPDATPASCGQTCDGIAKLTISGGAQPVSIEWDNGATLPALTGLCVGEYGATVTDGQGCSQALTMQIASADTEAPALALQNATVALGADGAVVLDPAAFDAASTDNCDLLTWTVVPAAFSCADAGQHTVTLTATDASGNAATGTAQVTIVDDIAPTLMCPDDVVTSLCGPAVEFSDPLILDNCPTGPAVLTEGLASGSAFPAGLTLQVFRATDAAGNTGTCSFTVLVQQALSLTTDVENASCAGICDGSVSLAVGGGLEPYTILWNNNISGPTLDNLCAGNYTATVSDAAGCSQTVSVEITQPQAIDIAVDGLQHDQAGAGVGSLSVTVSGGTTPYTFAWERDGQPFASTEDLTGLFAGQYQLDVTDANGCALAGPSVAILNNTVSAEEPLELVAWALAPNPASQWVDLRFQTPVSRDHQIFLFDESGRLVRFEKVPAGTTALTLDVSALPAGVWQLHLTGPDGGHSVRTLLIVR